MSIVWHGSYPLYFEDAREAFGAKIGLGYQLIYDSGFYAPLTELSFKYLRPLVYGMPVRIDIVYRPTAAAKIVFDYEIRHRESGELLATGHSEQVFLDRDRQLVWYAPQFYADWRKRWEVEL